MKSYVHLEHVDIDTYSIRFYNTLIDSHAQLINLPEYVGIGLVTINKTVGKVSSTLFRGAFKMNKDMLVHLSILLHDLGLVYATFHRHKGGKILKRTYTLPIE